jgi:DNA-binding transcriptional regulator YiaG
MRKNMSSSSRRKPKRSPLSQAVVKLREHLNESQQKFATRLGVAMLTVARWETSAPPRSMEALTLLWKTAVDQDQREQVAIFQTEMRKRIRPQVAELGIGFFSPQADPVALRELLDSISRLRLLAERPGGSTAELRQFIRVLGAKAEALKGSAQIFEHSKQDPFQDADWSKAKRRVKEEKK